MKTFLLISFLCLSNVVLAQMTTRVVRDSLFIPWELVYGPDDHIWFTQKNGYICKLDPVSGYIDTLYHETNTVVQGEGGMLGMALHPQFSSQPYVYVAYEYTQGSSYKERVVRYTYSNNSLSSSLTLIDNIAGGSIHNGCRLFIIGDKLFITTGDAGNSSNAQNLSSLNGKTLRINLDGSIPADNPITGSPLWTWGNRNAQGLVYANNKLYSSEHGPNNDDEVNILMKGRNYGWPNVQGFCNTPSEITFCNDSNVVEPLIAWTPTLATSGMDYYDHPMFPALQHSLLMTTLKDSKLYQLQLSAAGDSIVSNTPIAGIGYGRLRDICISPEGRIYISTSNSNASGSTQTDRIIEIYDPSFTGITSTHLSGNLKIYPNPSENYVALTLPLSATGEKFIYEVVDGVGKLVLKNTLERNNPRINTGELPDGIYHIRVISNSGRIFTGKIMKQ